MKYPTGLIFQRGYTEYFVKTMKMCNPSNLFFKSNEFTKESTARLHKQEHYTQINKQLFKIIENYMKTIHTKYQHIT